MSASSLTRQTRELRARALTAILLGGFALVVAGLARLQIQKHQELLELSTKNHVRLEVLRAPRGTIFDRNGVLLADSAPGFSVVFRPFPAESASRAREVLDPAWVKRVGAIVEVDSAEVLRGVAVANATGRTAVLRKNAPFAIRAAVEELKDELPGIEVQIEPLRRYPHGTLASHLLGYAGEISDAELDTLETYQRGDLIGRSGVERTFEGHLRGADGEEYVVVNANGRRVSTYGAAAPRKPTPGHDLVLTIDLRIQSAMEEAMADVGRGACIAIDVADGGVLGLVSRPAFDPNEFSIGLTRKRWAELSSGGSNPLLNRAIQGRYPPGSTFKIVTMLSALAAGIADAASRFQGCPGHYFYGGRSFGCWKRTGHGSLDFLGALQHSCDVYFYQIGPKLGLGRLSETARGFGLGARTGIDLPQEAKGLVPDQAYYDRRYGAGHRLKGMMLNLAIGQGELLTTPLQLALLLAETGNGGKALRPHVVKEVRGTAYRPEPPVHPDVTASPAVWSAVQQALELVVEEGTATASRVPGTRVAGKTGTAQNPHGEDHALFACYAPAEDPRIALAFVIENAGHGGSEAAPRAGRVLRRLFMPDSLNPDLARPRLRVTPPPEAPVAAH